MEGTVSPEQNKALAYEFFALFTASNIASALAMMTDDATWLIPGKPDRMPTAGLYSKDRIERLFHAMLKQLQDGLRMTVKSAIAEGDHVALEVESQGDLKNGRLYRQQYHFLMEFGTARSVQCASTWTHNTHTTSGSRPPNSRPPSAISRPSPRRSRRSASIHRETSSRLRVHSEPIGLSFRRGVSTSATTGDLFGGEAGLAAGARQSGGGLTSRLAGPTTGAALAAGADLDRRAAHGRVDVPALRCRCSGPAASAASASRAAVTPRPPSRLGRLPTDTPMPP